MNTNEIAATVVDALIELGIPYVIVGSVSSSFYGVARATSDVDFMIKYEAGLINRLSQKLGPRFRIDPQMQFETITLSQKNEAEVVGTGAKVEFFHLSDDEFQQERFRRKKTVEMFGRQVNVPTVEDVIVMKARWARAKDIEDILNVIAVQHDAIDWPYIYSWADRHGTRALLDDLRAKTPKI